MEQTEAFLAELRAHGMDELVRLSDLRNVGNRERNHVGGDGVGDGVGVNDKGARGVELGALRRSTLV